MNILENMDHSIKDLVDLLDFKANSMNLAGESSDFKRKYIEFKKEVRSSSWQQDFLSKPLKERQKIASNMRDASQNNKDKKDLSIMDVAANTIHEFFIQNNKRDFNVIFDIGAHKGETILFKNRPCEPWHFFLSSVELIKVSFIMIQ